MEKTIKNEKVVKPVTKKAKPVAKKSKKDSSKANFLKGIVKENPVLVSLLGMCPTLAVTKTLESAIGMGIAVIFVLTLSNLIVSLIRNIVPSEIRVPVYIIIIAALVSVVDMSMAAYLPSLHTSLGIFLPLIVVNCIILGRAEAFASKNKPLPSIIDALGMAIGFTLAIALLAALREFLGTGGLTIWGDVKFNLYFDNVVEKITNANGTEIEIVSQVSSSFADATKDIFRPISVLQDGAGAFLTLAIILAVIAAKSNAKIQREKDALAEKIRLAKAKKAAKLKALEEEKLKASKEEA